MFLKASLGKSLDVYIENISLNGQRIQRQSPWRSPNPSTEINIWNLILGFFVAQVW